jgi:hypothetical protein
VFYSDTEEFRENFATAKYAKNAKDEWKTEMLVGDACVQILKIERNFLEYFAYLAVVMPVKIG